MTTDEKILIEMLERVTNPDRENVDNLAAQMFCMIVQSNNDLVTKAHQLIVKKIHSKNITEAVRAIELLEECMSKAGSEFQKKTAKFNFLNELIALVLDKHDGPSAPVEIKKRIMECLMLWTVEHYDKSKIQEAYDNLKRQVNFEHNQTSAKTSTLSNTREQRSSILGKDDQVVAKLLKQGGTENYRKANLLIQHRVNQEAKRIEFICHLKGELKKIESTMEVLEEMLNSYNSEPSEADNRAIIQELYNNCKGHSEQMSRWPDFLGDTEPEFLEEVLNTKELLMVVIQHYKEIFEKESQNTTLPNLYTPTTSSDLISGLVDDALASSNQETNPTKPSSSIKPNNALDELSEIFGSFNEKVQINKPLYPSSLLSDIDMLEPINVFEYESKDKPATTTALFPAAANKTEEKSQKFNELKEIDKLSEEIFLQNLKEDQRKISFKKGTEKLTLNDMVKDKTETLLIKAKEGKSTMKDSLLKTLDNPPSDSEILKENKEESPEKPEIQEKELEFKKNIEHKNSNEAEKSLTLKPLAEISIDLDEVTPLDEGHRLLLDDDIQVSLYFTTDRPSEYVSVIVMSVTNKSKLPVNDFQFEASVKKPCKVRLLPPTDVAMAPRKPFRPPTPINQIILLLNPTQKPVDITCIIGYKLGDDPDPIKESIVTKDIP